MEAIDQLECEYFRLRFNYEAGDACVDWAVERLRLDQEGDDLEVVLLAGARGRDEVMSLVEVIIERYCGNNRLDDAFAAGKYISDLRTAYLQGKETIESLDAKFTSLYSGLGYPD